jgi:hypothetical protein
MEAWPELEPLEDTYSGKTIARTACRITSQENDDGEPRGAKRMPNHKLC